MSLPRSIRSGQRQFRQNLGLQQVLGVAVRAIVFQEAIRDFLRFFDFFVDAFGERRDDGLAVKVFDSHILRVVTELIKDRIQQPHVHKMAPDTVFFLSRAVPLDDFILNVVEQIAELAMAFALQQRLLNDALRHRAQLVQPGILRPVRPESPAADHLDGRHAQDICFVTIVVFLDVPHGALDERPVQPVAAQFISQVAVD